MSISKVLVGLCLLSVVGSILGADLGKVPCLLPLRMPYFLRAVMKLSYEERICYYYLVNYLLLKKRFFVFPYNSASL